MKKENWRVEEEEDGEMEGAKKRRRGNDAHLWRDIEAEKRERKEEGGEEK